MALVKAFCFLGLLNHCKKSRLFYAPGNLLISNSHIPTYHSCLKAARFRV
jgi:hypothetical protein